MRERNREGGRTVTVIEAAYAKRTCFLMFYFQCFRPSFSSFCIWLSFIMSNLVHTGKTKKERETNFHFYVMKPLRLSCQKTIIILEGVTKYCNK